MKKLNGKNKKRLCYLLTIPFLTLTNIPNIILSYDNDVFATTVGSSRGNRVRFSQEEDDQLRRLVEANGIKNWSLIAEQMPGRNVKQCRYRWHFHIERTDTEKRSGTPFTPEEDELLIQKVQEFGTKWTTITKYFSDRLPTSLRNRYNLISHKGIISNQVINIDKEENSEHTKLPSIIDMMTKHNIPF